MKRTEIINLIAEKINAKSYLEIGVQNPDNNFNRIRAENKVGVDPFPIKGHNYIYEMYSDRFFNDCFPFYEPMFDLVFVDGDHSHAQSFKDVENSLLRLSKNGVIIMHDVNPSREYMTREPKPENPGKWCGGCWKTFAKLRMTRPDLYMVMIPDDLGCGIIKFGKQELYTEVELTWDLFKNNKAKLMNEITIEELINKL